MSSAHDKYVALQRHRNAAALALDPGTTALGTRGSGSRHPAIRRRHRRRVCHMGWRSCREQRSAENDVFGVLKLILRADGYS